MVGRKPQGFGSHVSELRELVVSATPGPWDVGSSRLIAGPEFPTIWPRGRGPMCRFDLRPGVPKERNEADARLGSLAPDLALLVADMTDELEAWKSSEQAMGRGVPEIDALLVRVDLLGKEQT